jgi:hypothetical protein
MVPLRYQFTTISLCDGHTSDGAVPAAWSLNGTSRPAGDGRFRSAPTVDPSVPTQSNATGCPSRQVSASPRAQVNETGEGVQLALDVGTAGAEDDAGCAGGLELGEAGS